MDHEVHRQLKKMGCQHIEGEWYRCTPKEVKAAIEAVRERKDVAWNRDKTFGLRPEQKKAVDMTADFFDNYKSSTIINHQKQGGFHIFFGTVKCALVRPLPPIS